MIKNALFNPQDKSRYVTSSAREKTSCANENFRFHTPHLKVQAECIIGKKLHIVHYWQDPIIISFWSVHAWQNHFISIVHAFHQKTTSHLTSPST